MCTCSGTPFRIGVEYLSSIESFCVSEYDTNGNLVNYEDILIRDYRVTFESMPMFEAAMKIYLERRG